MIYMYINSEWTDATIIMITFRSPFMAMGRHEVQTESTHYIAHHVECASYKITIAHTQYFLKSRPVFYRLSETNAVSFQEFYVHFFCQIGWNILGS